MKKQTRTALGCAIATLFPSLVLAQGSLTPPGSPAPTQKSLQEIWNEIADLQSTAARQSDALAEQAAIIAAQDEVISEQNRLISLLLQSNWHQSAMEHQHHR